MKGSGALPLTAESTNGQARQRALAAVDVAAQPTSLIAYQSSGNVLIIGPEATALETRDRLKNRVACTVLATSAGAMPAAASDVYRAPLAALTGHLGAFVAEVERGDRVENLALAAGVEHGSFDLVLDLARAPAIRSEVLPTGYFAPAGDTDALEQAIAEIPELIGEFEKPKFFDYDADICAHSRSGIEGCRRCLDACPSDAIVSRQGVIEIDSYLCQGHGSCASACPSGAITYAFPQAADLLDALRRMLAHYRDAGGTVPCILFYDREQGSKVLAERTGLLTENVLPVEIEEIGAVGLDTWLSLLAYGADRVVLMHHAQVPASVRHEMDAQLTVARALLAGLGYASDRLVLMNADHPDARVALETSADRTAAAPAGFAALGGKRSVLRMAIDHLYAHAPQPAARVPLPAGAPFGEINLDIEACTLCMACVAVCPARALEAGGEVPALKFIEWNCVQCGICESACPEDAITRNPQMVFDADRRLGARTLKTEEPFRCVKCGKPFATQALMRRMREKLAGHWMFQSVEARERLEMCEDCRVQDMFEREGGISEPHQR